MQNKMTFDIKDKLFLAPMAGFTDKSFRRLCAKFGADITVTEMVSCKGLLFGGEKTKELIKFSNEEKIKGIQIFGSDPQIMKEATIKLQDEFDYDFIDINMGCPVSKVVKAGEGSALMKNIALASEIVNRVSSVSKKPVSVKFRKGWDDNSINAVEFAKAMEQSGANFIVVHPRTRNQMYSGKADMSIVLKIKQAVKIPIVANGDIIDAKTAKKILEETQADAIMIGRASLGNPWIFTQIKEYLTIGEVRTIPCIEDRIKVAIEFFIDLCNEKGERSAVLEARKHLAFFIKGLPHAAKMRENLNKMNKAEEIIAFFTSVI